MSDTTEDFWKFGEYPTSKRLNDMFRAFITVDRLLSVNTGLTDVQSRIEQLSALVGVMQTDPPTAAAVLSRLAGAEGNIGTALADILEIQAALNLSDESGTLTAQIAALRGDLNAQVTVLNRKDSELFNDYINRFSGEARSRTDTDLSIMQRFAAYQPLIGFNPVEQGNATKLSFFWSEGGTLQGAVNGAYSLGEIWNQSRAPSVLGASGWQKFPSGLILQYGYSNSQNAVSAPCVFPTSFNFCAGVFLTLENATNWRNADTNQNFPRISGLNGFDQSGFTMSCMYVGPTGGTALAPNEPFRFFAIGI